MKNRKETAECNSQYIIHQETAFPGLYNSPKKSLKIIIDYLYSIGKRPGEPHCPDTFRYKKNAIHI